MKTIWAGKFLDGKLLIATDEIAPDQTNILHYRIDAFDCAHWGILEVNTTTEATPQEQREAMEFVLQEIREQYLKFVIKLRDCQIKNHELRTH